MVQTLEILKGYIICEDPATRNKFFNLLDSFWHKQDGKVLKETVTGQDGTTMFKFLNADGSIHSVALPALPNSKPISFIQNLSEELAKLQPKVTGKGLSAHDLTTELLNKLNSLQNYQHPEFHQISEIQNLTETLEGKQPIAPEGYGFSQQNYSPTEKAKVAKLDVKHYAAPVNDLVELAALPEADVSTKQRRYVHAEGVDYFYDATLVEGDVAPDWQVEGVGFWKKAKGGSDALTTAFGLVGVIDGVNTTFTLPHGDKFLQGKTGLYLNGQRMSLGLDYTEPSESIIDFTEPPVIREGKADSLILDYYRK